MRIIPVRARLHTLNTPLKFFCVMGKSLPLASTAATPVQPEPGYPTKPPCFRHAGKLEDQYRPETRNNFNQEATNN